MVRIKHRYLLLNVLYPGEGQKDRDLPWPVRFRQPTSDKINAKSLVNVIRRSVEDLFGDYGSGMVAGGLVVKYFSPATSTAIIRVSRAHYRLAWAALTAITRLPTGEQCTIQVVRVSGTIKKSEEAAIRRARWSILRAQPGAQTSTGVQDVDMLDSIEDDDSEND